MAALPVLIALLLHAAVVTQEGPVVLVRGGRVRGEQTKVDGIGVRVFRGIPFAAPPVDRLRWRPPQPAAAWQEVRDARRFAPACPQAPRISYGPPFTNQSEDCLYLNVWTAATENGERRPVMVWIHGGGNVIGGADSPVYDGGRLAAAGVVLVSIQYRLGALGYLAHPALTAEALRIDGRAVSGNYGLLDQIAALEWVRDNIARFGGDRDRVTIFGESAGAANVTYLMASPLARGLFHRAVAESGYFGENVPRLAATAGTGNRGTATPPSGSSGRAPLQGGGRRSAEEAGLDAALRLGVKGENRPALDALRALPVEQVVSLPATIGSVRPVGGGGFRFGPIVDGHVLPRDPGEAWAAGEMHKVPFIAGSNLDDGSVFARASPIRTLLAYRVAMSAVFGPDAGEALRVFPAEDAAAVPGAFERVATVVAFRAPARRLVRDIDAAGGQAWLYLFSRNPRSGGPLDAGVIHGLEIPYVFGTLGALSRLAKTGAGGVEIDRRLSGEMMTRWVAFARDGNPDGGDRSRSPGAEPPWPRYSRTRDEHLEFGDRIVAGRELDREACDLVDRAIARRQDSSGAPRPPAPAKRPR